MRELSRFERWYGRDEPPVERRPVRAGRLTAELEGPDLRYVRAGGVEVVRRLYAAVRDQNWGTVAPELQNVRLEEGDDGFRLEFDARNVDPALGVDLSWHGEIVGGSDGSLACTFDGTANAAFRYNRIGWCVLHPAENAGKRYRARTPDGVVEGRLPAEVGAQEIVGGLPAPLFPSFDEVEIEVADGVWARFELEGDLFETEDQRNWTDASFKTYSTPLSLGFPHEASAGQHFRQAVRLTVTGSPPSPDDPDGEVRLELGDTVGRLPALGLGAASHGRPLSERDVALLGALRLDHVRLDVDLTQPGWRETLARGVADARALDVPLELAVFVGEDDGPIAELAGSLRSDRPAIARVLAFRSGEPTSSAATVRRLRDGLGDAVGEAPVYGGTNVLFTDLNRFRPELGAARGRRVAAQRDRPRRRRHVGCGNGVDARGDGALGARLLRRPAARGDADHGQPALQPGCHRPRARARPGRAAEPGRPAAARAPRRGLDARQRQAAGRGRRLVGHVLRDHGVARRRAGRGRACSARAVLLVAGNGVPALPRARRPRRVEGRQRSSRLDRAIRSRSRHSPSGRTAASGCWSPT